MWYGVHGRINMATYMYCAVVVGGGTRQNTVDSTSYPPPPHVLCWIAPVTILVQTMSCCQIPSTTSVVIINYYEYSAVPL